MHLDEERDGEYSADVEEDNEAVDGPGSVFVDDDRDLEEHEGGRELPVDDFASDTSSIIEELCCGDERAANYERHCERLNEILGGAQIPLSPEGDREDGGSRRVSIVNGLEEELPAVPVLIMVVKR